VLNVYTCVTGKVKDDIDRILESDPMGGVGVQYTIYTDRISPQKVHRGGMFWNVREPRFECETPQRTARWHKINASLGPGMAYPYSLWFDGSMTPKPGINFKELVPKLLGDHAIAAFKHPERDCVYDEGSACIRLKKDNHNTIGHQLLSYRADKYPEHNGLFETGVLMRRKGPRIKILEEIWWAEICKGSVRDQISLPVSLWMAGLSCGILEGRGSNCPWFTFRAHK
jgi:hypothetical protein